MAKGNGGGFPISRGGRTMTDDELDAIEARMTIRHGTVTGEPCLCQRCNDARALVAEIRRQRAPLDS
jgi:hypothetical protein